MYLHSAELNVVAVTENVKAVDKTRNMEHPGTFRNIPEHSGTSQNMKKLKYFFMKKWLIN